MKTKNETKVTTWEDARDISRVAKLLNTMRELRHWRGEDEVITDLINAGIARGWIDAIDYVDFDAVCWNPPHDHSLSSYASFDELKDVRPEIAEAIDKAKIKDWYNYIYTADCELLTECEYVGTILDYYTTCDENWPINFDDFDHVRAADDVAYETKLRGYELESIATELYRMKGEFLATKAITEYHNIDGNIYAYYYDEASGIGLHTPTDLGTDEVEAVEISDWRSYTDKLFDNVDYEADYRNPNTPDINEAVALIKHYVPNYRPVFKSIKADIMNFALGMCRLVDWIETR